MGQKKRVSIGELAKVAGVSSATVSRALRNNPMISEPVRRRIQDLAREMGYEPDPEAARLMSYLKRSESERFQSVIGILNAFTPPERLFDDAYTRAWIEGARARAKRLGYSVDELELGAKGMTPRRIDQIIGARVIRGVLIPPEPKPLFEVTLDWSQIMAVASTPTAHPLNLHRVLPHNFHNMRLLMDELVNRGFRRVGLLYWEKLEQRQMEAATSVYAHYAFFLQKLEPLPAFQWRWRENAAKRRQRLEKWLAEVRPEVVLGFNLHCIELLEEVGGLKVPDDLSFASYGDCDDFMTSIDQNPHHVGSAATDLLSAHILRSETGLPEHPKTILIEGRLREGATLGSA